jgi:hypothetical protein
MKPQFGLTKPMAHRRVVYCGDRTKPPGSNSTCSPACLSSASLEMRASCPFSNFVSSRHEVK